MSIGIYRDLAVGGVTRGLDAWADQQAVVQNAKVGCPPDPSTCSGQDWGIPPLHPLAMRARAYSPFISMLRANMRHAGVCVSTTSWDDALFWIQRRAARETARV